MAEWLIYLPAALAISHSAFCIREFYVILILNGDYLLEQR
jgi:hypothetical protein